MSRAALQQVAHLDRFRVRISFCFALTTQAHFFRGSLLGSIAGFGVADSLIHNRTLTAVNFQRSNIGSSQSMRSCGQPCCDAVQGLLRAV